MPKSAPNHRSYVERFTKATGFIFVFLLPVTAVAGAFAQNPKTPVNSAAATSPYVVDGLALGARVDSESPAYRSYSCFPSELFPEFTRCQRTQKQQDGSTRRSFETTSSILHNRDGKAVYINRNLAPWTFDRNEIQADLKQLSGKFGGPAREMRLPQRDGLQVAIIVVWGKIELMQLDADAISILAAGESPRKGLLIDYLGNLRRSAQLGLPVYSINGGAGYVWSASVDRNNRGHIRILAVDPAALSHTTALSPPPAEELPLGAISPKTEAAASQKENADAGLPVEVEKTGVETEVATTKVEEPAVPEAVKIPPLLTRPEAAESHLMERVAYWAVAGLIIVLMIAALLLLFARKRASDPNLQISTSEKQPANPAPRAQNEPQSHPPRNQLSAELSPTEVAVLSRAAAVADAILSQNKKEQKQTIVNESVSQKEEAQSVVVNDKLQQPSGGMTTCSNCNNEIFIRDKFCMHCGTSASPGERDGTMRSCSSCREKLGVSDRFCRHCGASCMAVEAPTSSCKTQSTNARPRRKKPSNKSKTLTLVDDGTAYKSKSEATTAMGTTLDACKSS
jgi:hypothetical protein